jgi:predicted amidohydrolase
MRLVFTYEGVSGADVGALKYVAYGHTMLCDCEGQIISTPTPENESEGIVFAELDPEHLARIRQGVPTLKVRLPLLVSSSLMMGILGSEE